MAKRIFTAHRVLRFLLNESGFTPSHAELDDMLHVAGRAWFRKKTGNTREYQAGRPVARESFQLTTPITEALRPFRRVQRYSADPAEVAAGRALAISSAGEIVLPKGLAYTSVLDVPGALESVEFLTDAQATSRLHSLICGPTPERPVAVEQPPVDEDSPAGWRIYLVPTAATLTYLVLPRAPHYEVEYKDDGTEVYDDTKSIDMPWTESQDNEIFMLALEPLGLNNRDQLTQAYARTATERGL